MKLIFDLDDTLIPNAYLFHLPAVRAAEIICHYLGVRSLHPEILFEKQREIDRELQKELLHAPARFPMSWARAYEWACRETGAEVKEHVRSQVLRQASAFVNGPWEPFPEAPRMLSELLAAGHDLYLVTAGSELLQRDKIKKTGMDRFFPDSRIYIVPSEKKEIYREIARDKPQDVIVVDDIMRHINAAVEIGAHAIFMVRQTHFTQAAPVSSRFHKTQMLDGIAPILKWIQFGSGERQVTPAAAPEDEIGC